MRDVNIADQTIPRELLDRFIATRNAMDETGDAAKEAEKVHREVEEQLWDLMDGIGVPGLRIDGFGTVSKTLKGPYCSIDVETDPSALEKFKAWCEEQNLYGLIFRFAPQMASLNPIVKKLREEGQATPPGIKVTEHRRLQVLRGRSKK